MGSERDETLEERVERLETELRQLREELTDWSAYASSLSKRFERLTVTLTAISPEWANALGRNPPSGVRGDGDQPAPTTGR